MDLRARRARDGHARERRGAAPTARGRNGDAKRRRRARRTETRARGGGGDPRGPPRDGGRRPGPRGRALAGRATDDGWQWEDASHLLESAEAEAFPALGGEDAAPGSPSRRRRRGRRGRDPRRSRLCPPPAAPAADPPAASILAAGSCGARWPARRAPPPPPAARRPDPRAVPPAAARGRPARPGGGAPHGPFVRRGRRGGGARRQLAAAFGVSRPDSRPSVFAASALEVFTKEVVKTARAFPRRWLTWRRGSRGWPRTRGRNAFRSKPRRAVAGGGPRAGQDLRRGVVRVRRRASATRRRVPHGQNRVPLRASLGRGQVRRRTRRGGIRRAERGARESETPPSRASPCAWR